jgi:flagellar hook-length control protein FliK
MIVRVDGGDLGEVALCVDRTGGAIRVTIGARDAAAEAALGSERVLLMQALQGHGITVDSVSVVRDGNFGTLPAQRPSATRRAHDSAQAEQTDEERARRRLSRKLNVIG